MGSERQSGARRGAITRARILAAARRHFAADGYERATIRSIAAAAGIDPSLVMRYFTNKEGLFVAAAAFDLRIPDLSGTPRRRAGERLAGHFFDLWEKDDTMRALLRTATSNERAADRMRAIAASQAIPAVAAVCGDTRRHAAIRANLIGSQFLGFAYCRYVLKLPALTAMKRGDVIKWLGPTVQRYLFAKLAA